MIDNVVPLGGKAEFTIQFKNADGEVVSAPAGVEFVSATPGVDSLSFDGTTLIVAGVAKGSDVLSIAGLEGSFNPVVEDLTAASWAVLDPTPAATDPAAS